MIIAMQISCINSAGSKVFLGLVSMCGDGRAAPETCRSAKVAKMLRR